MVMLRDRMVVTFYIGNSCCVSSQYDDHVLRNVIDLYSAIHYIPHV